VRCPPTARWLPAPARRFRHVPLKGSYANLADFTVVRNMVEPIRSLGHFVDRPDLWGFGLAKPLWIALAPFCEFNSLLRYELRREVLMMFVSTTARSLRPK